MVWWILSSSRCRRRRRKFLVFQRVPCEFSVGFSGKSPNFGVRSGKPWWPPLCFVRSGSEGGVIEMDIPWCFSKFCEATALLDWSSKKLNQWNFCEIPFKTNQLFSSKPLKTQFSPSVLGPVWLLSIEATPINFFFWKSFKKYFLEITTLTKLSKTKILQFSALFDQLIGVDPIQQIPRNRRGGSFELTTWNFQNGRLNPGVDLTVFWNLQKRLKMVDLIRLSKKFPKMFFSKSSFFNVSVRFVSKKSAG